MERLKPDIVVTWGPDGGYGHPDHRMVSNIATQLSRAGAPGMPERLLYMYLTPEMIRMANPQRGEPPLTIPQAKYFTVRVPFTPPRVRDRRRGGSLPVGSATRRLGDSATRRLGDSASRDGLPAAPPGGPRDGAGADSDSVVRTPDLVL